MGIIMLIIAGILLVGCGGWITAQQVRLKEQEKRLTGMVDERDSAIAELGTVRAGRDQAQLTLAKVEADHAARIEEVTKANQELETRFKGIADDVTKANSDAFLKQARAQFEDQQKLNDASLEQRRQAIDELVKPVKENLAKFEQQVGAIEKDRKGAYESLKEQVGQLRTTTRSLSEALRSSSVRGKWGEQQLRNILELSGLSEHIDYDEQVTLDSDRGHGRPDAVVRIPGDVKVVIDAKTPMDSYLIAHETEDDETRRRSLVSHADTLLGHAKALGNRNYAAAVTGSPDFVVMFVPADPILDEAMEARPRLWEDAWRTHGVLIATPGLLLAFLKTVALAWQRQDIQENAQKIADGAAELYDSLRIYAGHAEDLGKGLSRAVDAYNKSVGSLNRRVLPRAQRFEALGVDSGAKSIELPSPIEKIVRTESPPTIPERLSPDPTR